MERHDVRAASQTERTLLIVEDDKSFLQRLAARHGSPRLRGHDRRIGRRRVCCRSRDPRRPSPWSTCGSATATALDVISALKQRRPDARGIILTGYGNIATAVNAVKLGAVDYLAKPADADDVVAALLALEGRKAEPPEHPMSADRVRWEHIQRIYELCGRNVSETARRLNMHRRTLQRILAKRAPR